VKDESFDWVERECGACQACCQVMGIHELGKPEQQRCPHQCKKGCGIYAERPGSCQAYRCRWLHGDPNLSQRDRPDRLGVIFDNHSALNEELAGLKYIVAREVRPGAFKGKRAKRWMRALEQDRILVWVNFAGDNKVTGPVELLKELDKRQAAADAEAGDSGA